MTYKQARQACVSATRRDGVVRLLSLDEQSGYIMRIPGVHTVSATEILLGRTKISYDIDGAMRVNFVEKDFTQYNTTIEWRDTK